MSEQHFLSTEQAFEQYLATMCCGFCAFFCDGNCNEKDAEQHMKEKQEYIDAVTEEYQNALNDPTRSPEYIKMRKNQVENVDKIWMCDKYKNGGMV